VQPEELGFPPQALQLVAQGSQIGLSSDRESFVLQSGCGVHEPPYVLQGRRQYVVVSSTWMLSWMILVRGKAQPVMMAKMVLVTGKPGR